MAKPRSKRKQRSISLSDESMKRLDEICKDQSRTRSNAIEWLITLTKKGLMQ